MNVNDKMVELKDVVVTINGEEVNLGELSYLEFSELMEGLDEEQAQDVLTQIVEKVGPEKFLVFLSKVEELAELDEEGEEIEVETEDKAKDKKEKEKEPDKAKQEVLPPVRFVDMNDFYSYDPELVVQGIDSVSNKVGQYLAFVNAGMTPAQAFELITIEDKRKHELAMAEKQLELRKLESELQMRLSGVKQLLAH